MRANAGEGAIGCGVLEVPAVGARWWLAWGPSGLRALVWTGSGVEAAEALGAGAPAPSEVPEPYAGVLRRYLAGERIDPTTLPVELEGTAFQRKVWASLRRIPFGQVRSYASVAREIGSPRAMRAVGGANGKNPVAVVVPCHRVVDADMSLGGYSGGLPYKRFLLELEGGRLVSDFVQPGQLKLIE
ncbi:MAG TPA: methylated-DNA--[protein]-cysteine S-methyltransferase [Polyangiales bacterium]|nr:methylated-DNA--[protein]-cysteine S-methyltransferase [Polyangiales bacterium]